MLQQTHLQNLIFRFFFVFPSNWLINQKSINPPITKKNRLKNSMQEKKVVHKKVSQDCNKIRKSKCKKNTQPLKNFLKFP